MARLGAGVRIAAALALLRNGCCEIPPDAPGEVIARNGNSYLPELCVTNDRVYYLEVSNGLLSTTGLNEALKIPLEQQKDAGKEADAGSRFNSSLETPSRLFVSGSWITWFEHGKLARRKVGDNTLLRRRTWTFEGAPLAVDGERYFFEDKGGLFTATWDHLQPERLCPSEWGFLSPYAALDSAHVYVAPYASPDMLNKVSSIERVPRKGGSPSTLATKQPGALSLAVDDTHVYWAATGSYEVAGGDDCPSEPLGYKSDGVVARVAKAGGGATNLADGLRWPKGIRVDEAHVYWVSDGALYRVAKSGGGVDTVIAGAPTRVVAFALDGTHVYWSTNYGQVRRIRK